MSGSIVARDRRGGLDRDSPTGYVMGVRRILEAPETNVAIFAFLLNLTWEFAQVPLFAGMPSAEHWRAILVCGRATLGDVFISLLAFWTVAACARARSWVLRPAVRQVSGFVAVGVLITIVMEWLATQVLGRWTYGEAMPVIPLSRLISPSSMDRPPADRALVRSTPAHVSGRACGASHEVSDLLARFGDILAEAFTARGRRLREPGAMRPRRTPAGDRLRS